MRSSVQAFTLAILILSTVACPSISQQTILQMPPPTKWSETPIEALGVISPDCHSRGIYFRQFTGKDSWTFAPITALLSNGKSKVFDLRAATNFQERVIGTTFYVDGKGTIYAAIQIGHGIQWYVAEYDKTGRFIRKTSLPKRFVPSFLLAMTGNRMLVGGTFGRSSGTETHVKSLVAIFDRDGNQLKSLSLPEDDSEETVVRESVVKQLYYTVTNAAIEGGKAVLAEDGHIYILRAFEKPLVQVVSRDGDALRTFVLEPGDKDLLPTEFIVLRNSIAVGYFMSKTENVCLTTGQLILYSPHSGDVAARYSVKLAPLLLVCAQDRHLVYFTNPKGTRNYEVARVSIPAVTSTSTR